MDIIFYLDVWFSPFILNTTLSDGLNLVKIRDWPALDFWG